MTSATAAVAAMDRHLRLGLCAGPCAAHLWSCTELLQPCPFTHSLAPSTNQHRSPDCRRSFNVNLRMQLDAAMLNCFWGIDGKRDYVVCRSAEASRAFLRCLPPRDRMRFLGMVGGARGCMGCWRVWMLMERVCLCLYVCVCVRGSRQGQRQGPCGGFPRGWLFLLVQQLQPCGALLPACSTC